MDTFGRNQYLPIKEYFQRHFLKSGFEDNIYVLLTLNKMDENRYRDLVQFLQSNKLKRTWPKWINEEIDSKKKKVAKTNFRAIANGTVQRAGFMVQNGQLYIFF